MWKAGENSPIWKTVKHLVEDIENINSRFKVNLIYFKNLQIKLILTLNLNLSSFFNYPPCYYESIWICFCLFLGRTCRLKTKEKYLQMNLKLQFQDKIIKEIILWDLSSSKISENDWRALNSKLKIFVPLSYLFLSISNFEGTKR